MSRRFREQNFERKVYVGELGNGASKQALEDAFSYYGYLRNVWVARNPPGFAFVEFEDPRDAEDACRGLDGRLMNGKRMRVEMCKGHMKRNSRPPPRGRPFHPDDRCYECGERGHYARDCTRGKNSGHKKRSYSRSRSPARNNYSRSRSHSRSKSPMKKGRPASRSPGYGASAARSRSGSPLQNNYSRSRSRSRSRTPMKKARPVSKSSSRSRSRSPRNGDYLPYRE